jgi:hypothetical protein
MITAPGLAVIGGFSRYCWTRSTIGIMVGGCVLRSKVDRWGRITIRRQGKLHHIGIGQQFCGTRVLILIAGKRVKLLLPNGTPVRNFILDPTKDYQRMP